MEKNTPEKKFKIGGISATVWRNTVLRDGKQDSYCTVSIERTYKDKQGAWQRTNSFRTHDLPRAALVLQEAYKYVAFNDTVEKEVSV